MPEFNYLVHGLYKPSNAGEKALRADLLVEVEAKDNETSFTMVIEAQGFQHRPILKQGFIHIIVYDIDSVKGAIADAIGRTKNKRVYYPSDKGVDKDAVIKQFVDQLLLREGYWHSPNQSCVPFELTGAFSQIGKVNVVEMSDQDTDDEEDGNIGDEETPNGQQNDRESIMKCLDGIDSKFLDLTPVKNLSIDFTKSSCGSIKTNQLLITSLFASSNQESLPEQASVKKRSRSSSSSSDDQFPVVKKNKTNDVDDD